MLAVKKRLLQEKWIILCLMLSFLVGSLTFGYFMIRDNGLFLIKSDFNVQQIPFGMALNNLLKNDCGEWAWNVGLGTQTIGAYSFYCLGSPFYWISLLWKGADYPFIIGGLYILKYVIASVTSFLYIRTFIKEDKYALLGGLLYSFSGFQSTNLLFNHFHDVVALFPLLLLGLEHTMRTKKKSFFIISVFINCLVNYFFFVGEVVFLCIYFIVRFWDNSRIKELVKRAGGLLLYGIVGVGMAAVLFLPSIRFILGNSRSQFSLGTLYGGLGFRPMLHILKGLLFPGETMGSQSAIMTLNFDSTGAYLPMVGLVLVICYVWKNRDWLSRIMFILAFFSILPFLSSAFTLFTVNYQRWWYMLILLMCLASSRVLEDKEQYNIKKGVCINIILIVLFCIALMILQQCFFKTDLIFRKGVFLYEIIVSVTGLLLLAGVVTTKNPYGKIIFLTVFYCFITTFVTIHLYQNDVEATTTEDFQQKITLGGSLINYDDQYRYQLADNIVVLSGEAIGTGIFSSTISNSIRDFEELFDFTSKNFNLDMNSIGGLNELVGAKYEVLTEVGKDDEVIDVIEVNGTDYYIVEHLACPIGFAYESYMTRSDLMSLDADYRGVAMLDNLCVEDGQEDIVSEYLGEGYKNLKDYSDYSLVKILTERNIENGVSDFTRSSRGFACTTDYQNIKVVYFSVPYDKGWSASIDGERIEILETSGMMSIIVPSGNHEVFFQYKTPGFRAGIVVSAFSMLILVFILVYERSTFQKDLI